MSEVIVGGMMGLLGVVLGWFLSWLDRQGRIDICKPEVSFSSFGGERRITRDKTGKILKDESIAGNICWMHIGFEIMSYSTDVFVLRSCKIMFERDKKVISEKQTIKVINEDDFDFNNFNQIVLEPLKEQQVEVLIDYSDDFKFENKEVKYYLTYKNKLNLKRKKLIGIINIASQIEEYKKTL